MLSQPQRQPQSPKSQSKSRLYSLQILNYSGNALSKPYVNLYLLASGVSVTTLGVLLSIAALFEMLVPPLLSMVADHYRLHRLLYIGFISSLALGNLLLALFDQIPVLIVAVILIEATFRPTMTLGLQLVITRMSYESRQHVGRVRGFSSLGFSMGSFIANWLFVVGGYFALFSSAAFAYLTSLSLTGSLPQATTEKQEKATVTRVPRTRAFYLIAISMFFIMMGQRIGYAFWFIHFQQNLGLSTEHLAVLSAVMALSEIPFFVLLDRILLSINVRVAFWAGGVGMAFVWMAVGILPDSTWILPLILVRGFLFSIFHLSTFLVINQASHPENVATNQAIAQGTIPSIATLLTGAISGWIYGNLGVVALFTGVMSVTLIGMVISVFALRDAKVDRIPAQQQ
ncbi:MAG: MFS transporter [Aggregatilineales bacterium]